MKKILLLIIASFAINLNAQIVDCAELFISEYIEGPAQNNGIEIYNPTSVTIDLTGYSINRYSNGATSGPELWPLSGAISAGQAIAIGNGQLDSIDLGTYWSVPVDPAFYSLLDYHCNGDYDANSTFYFNGDDAMTLEKNGNIIDIFGKVGEDPGGAWTDDATAGYTDANGGTWWTKRQTLVRKPSVKKGVITNPILFNATLEYDSLPDATYGGMGSHTCDCSPNTSVDENAISYVLYPNPANIGEIITINAKEKIKSINVINILGEKVLTQISNKISTTNLVRGTYIINIRFTDGRIVDNKLIIE